MEAAAKRTSPTTRILKTTVLFLLPAAAPTKTVVVGQEDPGIDVEADSDGRR